MIEWVCVALLVFKILPQLALAKLSVQSSVNLPYLNRGRMVGRLCPPHYNLPLRIFRISYGPKLWMMKKENWSNALVHFVHRDKHERGCLLLQVNNFQNDLFCLHFCQIICNGILHGSANYEWSYVFSFISTCYYVIWR